MAENTEDKDVKISVSIPKAQWDLIREKYPTREALSFQQLGASLIQHWVNEGMPHPDDGMNLTMTATEDAILAARFLKWMRAKNHGPVEQKLKGWVRDCLTPGALPDPDPE